MRADDFERLYSEHAEGLFSFLAYRTGDRALAEDLLADTFERALRARRRFNRRRGTEKSWLYAIALNRLRDHARRAGSERRAVERVAAGSAEPLARVGEELVEDRDRLARAMAVLSSDERDTVALRFGAQLTVPEIARLSGERLTTAEGRLYRALRKLRAELQEPE